MILLLGGTSESAPLAEALLAAGRETLVSTATDAPLVLPALARRRSGRLDVEAMARLIKEQAVSLIVDATHPYAQAAHETALLAAQRTGVRCIRWVRAALEMESIPNLRYAADHEEAARLACAAGRTVLLTTGSLHLAPYVRQTRLCGCRVVARVLPAPESLCACRAAGLADADVIAARGPFTLEQNLAAIRENGVDVMVSKESGVAGGQCEKIEAARRTGCELVLVRRPEEINQLQACSIAELLELVGPGA